MRVAISGASGFVGTHLSAYLRRRGHDVVPLGRADITEGSQERLVRLLAPCNAVINLSGAPINRRWSDSYKEELITSRIETTRRLVEAINQCLGVEVFISTSAVGIYPTVGCYDEADVALGGGFLNRLCIRWEEEARRVQRRCVITRFGVVLSPAGGAFPLLTRTAHLRFLVVAGGGHHPFSWIALEDLLRAEEFLLTRTDASGVFNLTAPDKHSMREFMHAVARHYDTWLTLPLPAPLVRMTLGESADFVLEGQCAIPRRLLDAGFCFSIPSVADFLRQM